MVMLTMKVLAGRSVIIDSLIRITLTLVLKILSRLSKATATVACWDNDHRAGTPVWTAVFSNSNSTTQKT